jgi:hypothetical protein
MRGIRVLTLMVAAAVPAAGALASPPPAAAAGGAIHPGVQLFVDAGQCTGGFILANATRTYIAMAASCAIAGQPTDPYGCTTGSLPLGTPVEIRGAAHPGSLAYSSWLTMQRVHEADPDICEYNDFALVALDPADVAAVSPTVPVLGGPVGARAGGSTAGERVHTYGSSALLLGQEALAARQGVAVRMEGGGFAHRVVDLPPGIPGDAGSPVLDSSGRALGILITIAFTPIPLSNGVVDLARALDYMAGHTALTGVHLLSGTAPFSAR